MNLDEELALRKEVRDQTIDECMRCLGGRYGAAARKDLQSLKSKTAPKVSDVYNLQLEEAREIYDEITDLYETVSGIDKAMDFAESVMLSATNIMSTADNSGFIQEQGTRTLINMRDGLRKWVRD